LLRFGTEIQDRSEYTRITFLQVVGNLGYDGKRRFPYARSNYCIVGSSMSAVSKPRVVSVEDEYRGSGKKDCKNREPGGNIKVMILFG
jgi:hypothetical protein